MKILTDHKKVHLLAVIIFAIGTISESIPDLGNGLFGLGVFDKITKEMVFAASTMEYAGKIQGRLSTFCWRT